MNNIVTVAGALTSSLPAAGFARVDDFNGDCHHVDLTHGLHRVAVRLPGYSSGCSTCT